MRISGQGRGYRVPRRSRRWRRRIQNWSGRWASWARMRATCCGRSRRATRRLQEGAIKIERLQRAARAGTGAGGRAERRAHHARRGAAPGIRIPGSQRCAADRDRGAAEGPRCAQAAGGHGDRGCGATAVEGERERGAGVPARVEGAEAAAYTSLETSYLVGAAGGAQRCAAAPAARKRRAQGHTICCNRCMHLLAYPSLCPNRCSRGGSQGGRAGAAYAAAHGGAQGLRTGRGKPGVLERAQCLGAIYGR